MTQKQRYALRKFFLRFLDDETEQSYRTYAFERALLYFRISWASVLLFGGVFRLLDESFFGADAPTVGAARGGVLLTAGIVFGLSFTKLAPRIFNLSSLLFILTVGLFCTLQTALSPAPGYSPYLMGVFWAFMGIFSAVGVGFTQSVIGVVAVIAVFELFLGAIHPVEPPLLLVYNFFLVGIAMAFVFIAYLVERIYRTMFVTTAQLQTSLDEVKALSGLLPICASCKKIRDDKGYWNQIESYISTHSEVQFSHGVCPDCVSNLYREYTDTLPPNRKTSHPPNSEDRN